MDAVESASLQRSHSTSSHSDLYVLKLRKRRYGKRKGGVGGKLISIVSSSTTQPVANRKCHVLSLVGVFLLF